MPIIDTSCIIALVKSGELDILEKLFSKVVITPEILEEMSTGVEGLSELREALDRWIFVHKPKDARSISTISSAESITLADASIIILAKEMRDIVISNDAALIRTARIKGVECWWLTTCIIEAIKRSIMTKKKAREVLFSLVTHGMYLDNKVYAALLEEIERL